MNGWNTPAGRGPFVAAFGQSNEGDVSPNTKGPVCMFPKSVEGQPCEFEHSTCAGKTEGCQGQGPFGWSDFANTHEIGMRQAMFAQELFANATEPLTTANFGYVHTYVDMSNVTGKQRRKRKSFSFIFSRASLPSVHNFWKRGAHLSWRSWRCLRCRDN